MAQFIDVVHPCISGTFQLLQLFTEGPFRDIVKFQQDAHTIAYVHRRFTSLALPAQDARAANSPHISWQTYLLEHWDTRRNHLRTDCLDEFYRLFRTAHAPISTAGPAPCARPQLAHGNNAPIAPIAHTAQPAPIAQPAQSAHSAHSPHSPQPPRSRKAPVQLSFNF